MMHSKRHGSLSVLVVLVLFLIFSFSVYSEDVNYADIDEAILNLDVSSGFSIQSDGSNPKVTLTKVILDLYPATDYRQELLTIKTDGVEDNGKLIFTYQNPSLSDYYFSYNAKLRVKNEFRAVSKKIPFPLEENYEFVNEYTKPTEYIDFDKDENIRITARQIAEGEDDLYVIVYKLSKWITDNIEYNLTAAGDTVEKASKTLDEKKGVCDEATILFTSFARSLGIPTKYVSGVAYTNLEGINDWGAHAWAEVYFKDYGWIPFDFTYQQYGFVDASHIKLKESDDANDASVKYEWTGHDAELKTKELIIKTTKVEVLGDKENPISISIRPLHSFTGPQSYNAVEATVTNLKNNYFTTNVYLSKSPQVIDINNQVILLKPLEKKKLYWIIYSNATIEEDSRYYIYALEATSLHISDASNYTVKNKEIVYSLNEIQSEISQIKKEEEKIQNSEVDFSCSNKNIFYDYEPVLIECKISNKGLVQNNLKLCLINDCEIFNLGTNEEKYKKYSFFLNDSKKYYVKPVLENKNIYKTIPIEFEVVKKPKLNISMTSKPLFVNYDDWYGLQFRLNKNTILYDVDITFTLNDYVQTWHIDTFEVAREYKITLKADNVKGGNNSFFIDVKYHDSNNIEYEEKYSDYITVNKLKFFQKIKYYLVLFVSNMEDWLS